MQTLPRALRRIVHSPKGITISAVLIFACIYGGVWVSRTTLFATATTVQPQSFTELYFADPDHLPEQVREGVSYDVRFVIANHTGSGRTYSYVVSVQSVSAIKHEQPVSVHVPAGWRSEQTHMLHSLTPGEPIGVSITLDTNEVIRFYARP